MDAGVEVLHDEVRVLQGEVHGDEGEQQPGVVVVVGADVGLEHVQDGGPKNSALVIVLKGKRSIDVLEDALLGPSTTGARKVLGHLELLGVVKDAPGQEVPVLAAVGEGNEIAKQTFPHIL